MSRISLMAFDKALGNSARVLNEHLSQRLNVNNLLQWLVLVDEALHAIVVEPASVIAGSVPCTSVGLVTNSLNIP